MLGLIVGPISRAGVVAMLAMLLLPACSGGENRQAQYLVRAQKHMAAGDYSSARIDVRNALQINANSAEGRYLLALLEEREKLEGGIRQPASGGGAGSHACGGHHQVWPDELAGQSSG